MDQELVQYLGERFDRQEQRFNARFEEVNTRLDERIEEVKRHTGILVEGLRQEIHHVAEGLLMHIEVRHREDRDYFDRKFEDTQALTRSSYDHLQQQQDQTRQRVENLERKSPN
ncbi:MAG: hypothetical protein EPO02_09140 [Nitrospirae bacterium]|nr:MAG: hypothetical protein EPO02_09140 [Nitrospirota bacterium]